MADWLQAAGDLEHLDLMISDTYDLPAHCVASSVLLANICPMLSCLHLTACAIEFEPFGFSYFLEIQ